MNEHDDIERLLSAYSGERISERTRVRIRARLMQMPTAVPAPAGPSWPGLMAWLGSARVRSIGALVSALVLLVSTSTYAAADSLPGDPAYALRTAVEDVQIVLAPAEERPGVLAKHLDQRLGDIKAAIERRPDAVPAAAALYAAELRRVDHILDQARSERRPEVREAAARQTETHLAKLQEVAQRLPDRARAEVTRVIEAQEQRAKTLRKGPERPAVIPAPSASASPAVTSKSPLPSASHELPAVPVDGSAAKTAAPVPTPKAAPVVEKTHAPLVTPKPTVKPSVSTAPKMTVKPTVSPKAPTAKPFMTPKTALTPQPTAKASASASPARTVTPSAQP